MKKWIYKRPPRFPRRKLVLSIAPPGGSHDYLAAWIRKRSHQPLVRM